MAKGIVLVVEDEPLIRLNAILPILWGIPFPESQTAST